MDVIVLYKWGFDPEDAYISPSAGFKWKRGKLVASDDDAAAMASARALAAKTGGRLVGATMGNGDASWAAARGAAESFSADALMPQEDEAALADILSQVVVQAAGGGAFDVVAIADAADRAGVAPALAAKLGLPCVLGVLDFAADADNPGCIVAHRALGNLQETLRFKPPVLISVSATRAEEAIPSMKEMLAARKAPLNRVALDEPEAAKVVVESREEAELKMARLFEGEPAQAAASLVDALRADGVLRARCKREV